MKIIQCPLCLDKQPSSNVWFITCWYICENKYVYFCGLFRQEMLQEDKDNSFRIRRSYE